ncbi:SRPBCC domain-containing protein [Acholeplasma hippikon]|uniref:Activator of Hsp90 ATPase homolog 1-like protein n=1 Tax=Acholeplasma hippikon TaxID=264636 RepID=A0A449BIE8_9MOLU|nr:SRPBCC domain-containing protein [Acholeplasma hippikon]VEU82225.1 Activator of Hsp90 ATPase homolog 1-like protein [Acholeplasma hippikon]
MKISIDAHINEDILKVWDYYNDPKHIVKWNQASSDWHSPHAVNHLKVGGTFSYRMEAKDGSAGFDFTGKYTEIQKPFILKYVLDDGREVDVLFKIMGSGTHVFLSFDPEDEYPEEFQKQGWNAILQSFKKYCESLKEKAD